MNPLVVLSAFVAAASAQYIPAYNGYATPLTYATAPVVAKAAPVVAAAPAVPHVASSQYQAQDEFANFNYGYTNINSAKVETGNAYGGVAGSYKYVDANGLPQRVDYVADDAGFRITGATNLPVAPVAPVYNSPALPVAPVFEGVPMKDTPEVAAAKAEFFKAFEAAKNRAKRSLAYAAPIAAPTMYSGLNPYYYGGYNSYALATPVTYASAPVHAVSYAAAPAIAAAPVVAKAAIAAPIAKTVVAETYAAPVVAAAPVIAKAAPIPVAKAVTYAAPIAAPAAIVASAPAAREAILTKIKLNPGHAVSYRVD